LEIEAFLAMAAAVTIGAGVQAAIGFAFGLITAPVLLVAMQSSAAIQVLVVVHIVQSAILVPGLWRGASRHLLSSLMLGSIIGFPIGMLVFLSLDLRALTIAIGSGLILFAALLALRERGYLRVSDLAPSSLPRWSLLVTGGVTGFLTAVLVMPGPPIMILNAWTRMSKNESRSLSLTFFAFCYVMAALMHATWGGMPVSAWQTAAMLTPFVIVGTLVGQRLSARLSEGRFRAAILVVVTVSGLYALWSAI